MSVCVLQHIVVITVPHHVWITLDVCDIVLVGVVLEQVRSELAKDYHRLYEGTCP